MAIAYGVEIPGTEGRAGMAALSLSGEVDLAGGELERCVERLPAYARPMFLRIIEHVEMTGTLKVRKVELQRQGFDPQRLQSPLYYRDVDSGSYRVLDASAYARILAADIRF